MTDSPVKIFIESNNNNKNNNNNNNNNNKNECFFSKLYSLMNHFL